MIAVWGHRPFGRIDEYRGQYAETVFFHINMVPIAPVASAWMTRGGYGVPLPLQRRSVLAAYLRWWVPLPALGMFVIAPGVITAILGLALLAASAWSWTWLSLPASARKRSDFNLLAFNMRCEPSRLSRVQRDGLAAALKAKWQASGAKQPPEDVARFGAANLDEAAVAYGILRLAALEHGHGDELADRLLQQSAEVAASHGIYRDRDVPREIASEESTANANDELARAVAARIYATPRPVRVYSAPPAQSSENLFSRPRAKLLAAAVCAVFSIIGLLGISSVLFPRHAVTLGDLTSHRLARVNVSVHCDALELVGHIRDDAVLSCHLGDRALLVVGNHTKELDLDLDGQLHSFDEARFHAEKLRADPQFLDVYLEASDPWIQRGIVVFSIACAIASLVLVVVAVRQWRANKTARAATAA